MSWNDFNDAEDQHDVIPAGTLAKVRMQIRPGGFNDEGQGWTGGYATRNATTGACYLDCEFVVLEGQFGRRKVFSKIGLYSSNPKYANMGRSLIKAILNSARGISHKDNSPQAQQARSIRSFADLDGIEFAARIDVEKGERGEQNRIQRALTPDHKDYAAIMGRGTGSNGGGFTPPAAPAPMAPAVAPQAPVNPSRPSWAQ